MSSRFENHMFINASRKLEKGTSCLKETGQSTRAWRVRNLGDAFKKGGEGAEKRREPAGKTSLKAKRGDGSQKQVVSGVRCCKEIGRGDFPGGSVVKTLLSNAGGAGLIPSRGTKILYATSRIQLCDPMNCSLPGSSVRRISHARILEWVAVPFSRVSSQSRD